MYPKIVYFTKQHKLKGYKVLNGVFKFERTMKVCYKKAIIFISL